MLNKAVFLDLVPPYPTLVKNGRVSMSRRANEEGLCAGN
jgi:hypothetical protein